MSTRSPRRRDVVIVALLVLGLLGSLVMVIFGGPDAPPVTEDGGRSSLPVEDLSVATVSQWSGLAIPADAADFLTARPSDTQLDITFTIPAEREAEFVSDSGLADPVPGTRLVLHSSPLWKLNPGGDDQPATDQTASSTAPAGPEIRGVTDVRGDIVRVVELYDESPGVVRARIVLTPAG